MSTVAKAVPPCQVPASPAQPRLVPPRDILPNFLPGGGISLLAGAPNLGKTALLAGLLRDLLAGRAIFGMTPRVVAVGYINADRGWDKGAGMWLQRAGVAVPFYSMADDETFSPKRLRRKLDRVDVLAAMIDSLHLPPDSLIIVDPVSLFLGGNLLDYDACMVACHEIRAYLRLRQLTMLGVAHSGKMKADKSDRYVRTSDQILGSTAIPGFTDAVLHLASPEELGKDYYQLTWHPHGAKPQAYLLERDEQGLFLPYSGVDEANKHRVLRCFPEPPQEISLAGLVDAAQQYPLSRATVKRVLDALVLQEQVVKVKYGHYARRGEA